MNVIGVVPGSLKKGYACKYDRSLTIENVELKETLDKAVKDAKLSTSEIYALNKKFYPDGGGFNLFPLGKDVVQLNYYSNKEDRFTHELNKIVEDASPDVVELRMTPRKSGSNFTQNLAQAYKKLAQVLKF